MRNKDTGEFELVVGDKQLLSGFFLGVLLLAVVFALGYVLGRGSAPSKGATPDTAALVSPSNGATESRPQPASSVVPASTDPGATVPPTQTADASQPAATPPAEPPPQPTTVPAKQPSAPAPAPPKAAPPPADPENGSFWQVLAGSQSSAESMLKTLKGKGFPVSTRPGPNSLTLVWVGPYTDKESFSHAKKQLEEAGVTNIFKKP